MFQSSKHHRQRTVWLSYLEISCQKDRRKKRLYFIKGGIDSYVKSCQEAKELREVADGFTDPLALFILMLPKPHLTSHSRTSGCRWVITTSWLSGSWRSFLYSASVYSCHLFLISCASVRSIPFLFFIVPISMCLQFYFCLCLLIYIYFKFLHIYFGLCWVFAAIRVFL